jgi:hypothetical protein
MRRFAFYFALVSLTLSLVVHLASFFSVSLFEEFAFLHIGIFVLGIPAAFSAKNWKIKKGPWWPPGASLRALTEGGPTWGPRALIAGQVYALIQFVALLVLSQAGTPAIREGKYILHSHGRLIRELTETEYGWQLAHVARMFSAMWALFYLLFIVWYWPKAEPANGDGGPMKTASPPEKFGN